MARIIEEIKGSIAQCKYCNKLIEYSKSDMKSGHDVSTFGSISYRYIICPNCKQEIQF